MRSHRAALAAASAIALLIGASLHGTALAQDSEATAEGSEPPAAPAPTPAAATPAMQPMPGDTMSDMPASLRDEPDEGAANPAASAEQVPPQPVPAAPAEAEAATPAHTTAGDAGPWKLTRPPMPFEIIRSLQFLQDQVARGNGDAIRVQAALLRRFGPVFLATDPELWADPRNMRAAALFVFSGGPPSVLEGILASSSKFIADRTLMEGALAYVQNRLGEAKQKLSSLDFRPMEPGIAAHINLVLGQINQLDNPKSAIAYLDEARLLAPGGLIEEAALRLEVMLVEAQGDKAKSNRLARQYFDRFGESAYAGNFRARFAAVYAERKTPKASTTMAEIDDATARLPMPDRLSLYLAVGRRALVFGNMSLAGDASSAALALDAAKPADRQRAILYSIASSLPSRSIGEATATLNSIDPNLLLQPDQELLKAAYSALEELKKPALAQSDISPATPEPQSTDVTGPVVARAQRLLDAVSNDLKVQGP
ncbi:hypothetical protein [Mangrovicella endophytica]|uniref:hypothetical protein n=1 Tax=Mangrovicella endophytica TaxID=2066697 RepID=UPI000C9E16BD|nr:hypothetical protein [Mangrovicella endophytica]